MWKSSGNITIIRSDLNCYFKTPQAPKSDPEARILKDIQVERRLFACELLLKAKPERLLHHNMTGDESEFITITPNAENQGNISAMLPCL